MEKILFICCLVVLFGIVYYLLLERNLRRKKTDDEIKLEEKRQRIFLESLKSTNIKNVLKKNNNKE